MGSYILADCPFDIRFLKGEKEYGDFYSAEVETKESIITVCDYADVSVKAYGVEYCTEKDCRFFRAQKNRSSVMFANNDWSNVKICRGNNGKFSEELMITAIYSRLCEYNTLFMHASFVDLNGNGVIFAGPSGIGKTTQAELWAKHLGATVVNGDKAFVRAFDKDVYGYGAPWSGSSPYCLNKKSVLKGIVVLLQSDKNSIKRLDSVEATARVLPHVFMHHWDENCVEKVLATFDSVLKKVPVWLLECKPDKEAVMITKEAVLSDI